MLSVSESKKYLKLSSLKKTILENRGRCDTIIRVHLNQWDIELRGEGNGLAVLVYPALVFSLIALRSGDSVEKKSSAENLRLKK